jgi:aminomethyltransferase
MSTTLSPLPLHHVEMQLSLEGAEKYRVPGSGSIIVQLFAGDEVAIINMEGGQPAELAAFDRAGRGALAALGIVDQGRTTLSAALTDLTDPTLASDTSSSGVVRCLQQLGVQLDRVSTQRLFDKDTLPGTSERFTATADVILFVRAPGPKMLPFEQTPPTDLRVLIKRRVGVENGDFPLPAPLAESRLDFRVNRRTAESYEVKAGEFIQIIDVAGKQCSDFLAFQSRSLQAGVERDIDGTATRTLMGMSYPQPGLFSKFYDRNFEPLVEVIQDTVGRHDTFALACTAKYYADMGYPGHANCSDNFNDVLKPYLVAPRPGWPAINFFYNTRVDCRNVIYLDEPWSRPGDYVLLRALTDLVCASSACPDDIDPANAWNPTDIHVRVYPEKNSFSKGVAFRMTSDAEPRLTRETAFHARTSALTRNFSEYRGFWLPSSFAAYGTTEQYLACREGVVLMDLSPLRKFEITGPDAEALMQATLTRNIRKLAVGQIVYSAMCNETGGMIDDGTLFRLGDQNFRWVGGDDYDGVWLREKAQALGLKAWVRSSTDQLHNLAVQGPRSRDLLKEVIWTSPKQPTMDELGWFKFTIGRVGSPTGAPLLVSRTGYTGELGYEVWCHPDNGLEVWDALWEAGQKFEIAPIGLDALDVLRIESGLIFSGYEFTDQIDPFEAGIGFAVALDTKADDYIGKTALLKRKAHPQRTLVGLEIDSQEIAVHGDCVHVGKSQVGVVTSGVRSPLLSRNIALCRMAVEYAELGTAVEIGKLDGHMKRIPARVVKFPFYDPDKKRPRS